MQSTGTGRERALAARLRDLATQEWYRALSNPKDILKTEWFSAADIYKLNLNVKSFPKTQFRIHRKAIRDNYERREVKAPGRKGIRFEFHFRSFPPDVQRNVLKSYKITTESDSAPFQNPTSTETPPVAQADEAAKSEYLWNRYASVPGTMKQRAQDRLAAVQAVDELLARGLKLADAKKEVAEQYCVSIWALSNWIRHARKHAKTDQLPALLPCYVGRVHCRDISPEAWDVFIADFLRLERPAASACYKESFG